MKILIAYDGSSSADLALEDMRRAGLTRVAEAMVLSVSELWIPVVENVGAGEVRIVGALPVSLEKAESLAQTACERVQSYFPDCSGSGAFTHRYVTTLKTPAGERSWLRGRLRRLKPFLFQSRLRALPARPRVISASSCTRAARRKC